MHSIALTRKTGRIISAGRATLALLFLLAAWLDPAVPVQTDVGSFWFINLYLLWTALLMMVAWRSWWFDFRLAPFAQGVDIVIFLAAIYNTESRLSELQSPFLACAAFLLAVSTARWNWRATVATAIVLILANVTLGLTMVQLGLEIDEYRFAHRTAYMTVLAGILIWLSLSRSGGHYIPYVDPTMLLGKQRDELLNSSLDLIASSLGARQVVLAFAVAEEPWVEFRHLTTAGISVKRSGPSMLGDHLAEPAPTALLSVSKSRMITAEGPAIVALNAPVSLQLARSFGVDEGVLVPLRCATGSGHIIAWDCDTYSVDDLPMLSAFGDMIGHALDRQEMAGLARKAAEAGVRNAVARDLHDSVAQFLAGASFRLEALRRWTSAGHDPAPEIDSIKSALRREQSHLRQLIERLRRGEQSDHCTEIANELRELVREAGKHWRIETELNISEHSTWVSVQLSHEIRQLVREGIANAARHGKCRKVSVTLSDEDGMLKLCISDDGIGFPNLPEATRPRSISERVEALGGQFFVDSTPKGARLDIKIRTGEFA